MEVDSSDSMRSTGVNVTSETEHFLFIAMELCDGTLQTWMQQNPNRMLEDCMKKFQEICCGVDFIHKKKIIHRDLKPSNIYSSQGGQMKIGDFGLATNKGQSRSLELSQGFNRTERTWGAGTPFYMAPEQKAGGSYNHKVDIYSLGVILMELLIHFNTSSEKQDTLRNIKNRNFVPSFESGILNVLSQMLKDDPVERPEAVVILMDLSKKAPE